MTQPRLSTQPDQPLSRLKALGNNIRLCVPALAPAVRVQPDQEHCLELELSTRLAMVISTAEANWYLRTKHRGDLGEALSPSTALQMPTRGDALILLEAVATELRAHLEDLRHRPADRDPELIAEVQLRLQLVQEHL
ncbi:hypothetical protein [Pseudoclavibacter sp. AY1H1]|uniref:hypothetical protein n=1 Tax=Pseudoclavibacter sp. AY1H1 TaxID=2080584 RepID=UPI0011AFEF16|nr:hypothetical protein [Pseudoclavibacter sp. AY1H1]